MTRLTPLPEIMVAPNGARHGKADHPALPITIDETVRAARAAFEAGAQALHAHIRAPDGTHSLDAGAYKALLSAMAREVPDMAVQITTEAVGRFSPEEQRETVLTVNPEGASVALREMWPEGEDGGAAQTFYDTCAARGIAIQHICYTPFDLARLLALAEDGALPAPLQAILVLGSYAAQRPAMPSDITPFMAQMDAAPVALDWAICAFGPNETACLLAAHDLGGKLRIGFENNLVNADGLPARDNAERVADLVAALRASRGLDAAPAG